MEDQNNKHEKWDDPHLTKVTWKTKTVTSVERIRVKYSQQIVSTTYFKESLVPAAISEKKAALTMWQILFCWPWEISRSNLHCWLAKLRLEMEIKTGISLSKETYFDETLWVIISFSPPTSWKIIINLLSLLWCDIKVQNIISAMILKWKTNN